jgi:dipeptidyl-peptidase-4
VWNVRNKTLRDVSGDGKQLYVTFSPDGKKLAYVREGNMYIKDLATNRQTAVTFDGDQFNVLYGMGDMLYENGFGVTKAYEWSADSKSIALLRLNEAPVKKYPINDFSRNYPQINNQSYPIPGEAIPEPQVFVYQIDAKLLSKVNLGINPDQYVVGFKWMPDNQHLIIQQLNRAQNNLNLLNVNVKNGKVLPIYAETAIDYVDVIPQNIFPVASRNSFLWLSEKDGYRHIYEMKLDDTAMRQITKGAWEDEEIKAVDEETGDIFYLGKEDGSRQQNLYKINFEGKNKARLTTDADGYHNVWMSHNKHFFFDEQSSINTPTTYRMYNSKGKPLFSKFISNAILAEKMKGYAIPQADFFSILVNDTTRISAYLIKPAQSFKQKLPLLFYVYGGNTQQEVADQWRDKQTLTLRYLANQGYYVVCLDPRGTPGRGASFRKANWDRPGEREMEDIVSLKKFMGGSFKNSVDTAKTGIMGWSYGGFLAALAQTKYAGNFKAAVAIAPVTNWRLYDNVYTERLLKAPSENAELYKASSPSNYADKYIGGLFLIHGTADDIVHLNNSLELSKELTNAGKDFQQHFYPDKTHSLTDNPPNTIRVDLYKRIERFLKENLSN